MNILALDTSTDICAVGVSDDQGLRCEYRARLHRSHAERIIGIIDQVLMEANLKVDQLDGFAVSIGPGSFTGLRIGLSVVKGLAFDPPIPVVPVNTLDVLAMQGKYYHGPVCSWIKAQAQEAYAGIYHMQEGRPVLQGDYSLVTLHEAGSFIPANALVLQIGMPELGEAVPKEKGILLSPADDAFISPLHIIRLSLPRFHSGDTIEADALEPNYLKDFKAKKGRSIFQAV